MTPFPRDETARQAEFDKAIREAIRAGHGATETLQKNIAANLHYWEAQFWARWKQRHLALHLRSSDWPAPRRSEVAARFDDYDREQHTRGEVLRRNSAREALTGIRWARWFSAHLSKPAVLAELAEGPSYEYLHWGVPHYACANDRMKFLEPTVLDNKGRVVAFVTREPAPGRGPTIKAWLLVRPGAATEPPLTWCLFRQRKQAVAWLVNELHKRSIAIFGNEIDLPEYGV